MRTSRKQPAVTRHSILEAAGAGFARGGVSATGIGAIVAGAGMTKGALFHHFEDKHALVLAWIRERLAPDVDATWGEALAAVTSLEQMIGCLRAKCEAMAVDDPVSVLVAVVAEAGPTDPVLAAALAEVMEGWRQSIADMLGRGQAEGWIHRSIEPRVEAGIVVAMFAGFAVDGRCAASGKPARDTSRALVAYLETLRPQ